MIASGIGPITRPGDPRIGRRAHIALLAWVSMLGTDLLIHGGVLARLYATPLPFLLDSDTAFRRIPLGYASFLVLAVLFTELAAALQVRTWQAGARLGLVAGGAIWASLTLGVYSIATAPGPLMVGWFVGQTLELGVAGALVGSALGDVRMAKLWKVVVGWCLIAFVITVVLQNTGLAPAGRIEARGVGG